MQYRTLAKFDVHVGTKYDSFTERVHEVNANLIYEYSFSR